MAASAQLLRQTVLYLPAQLVSPGLQLVSVIVWTYFLPPEQLGRYMLVLATQELSFLLTLSWFAAYALRFTPENDDPARRRFLAAESSVLAIASCLQIPGAFLLAAYLQDGKLFYAAAAILIFFTTRNAVAYLAERARADGNTLAYTCLQITGPAGGFLLGLAAVKTFGGEDGAALLLFSYGAAQALACLLGSLLMGGWARPARPERALMKAALSYGVPLLALSVLGWLGENSLRYIVEFTAGTAAFGLLAVGWGLGRRVASLAAMLVTTAAFPLAARLMNRGDRQSALSQLRSNAALLLGVLMPATIGLWWIGGPFVDLAIAPEYQETTRQVLGPALVSGAAFFMRVHAGDQPALLERRFGVMALVDLCEIVLVSVFCLAGLKLAGLAGAAAGAAAGSVLSLALSLFLAWRLFDFTLPGVPMVTIGAACGVMVGVLHMLPEASRPEMLALTVLAGVLAYVSALLAAVAGPLRRHFLVFWS